MIRSLPLLLLLVGCAITPTGSLPLPLSSPVARRSVVLPPVPPTATVMLEWDPSPDAWVVGYALHHGPSSGTYTTRVDVGNVTCAALQLVRGEIHYIVATAYTAEGLESPPSNEIAYTPPALSTWTLTVWSVSALDGIWEIDPQVAPVTVTNTTGNRYYRLQLSPAPIAQ